MKKSNTTLQTWSALAAGLLTASLVSAQTENWTGAGANQNWSTVGNWSAGVVPSAATNVLFTSNTGAAASAGTVDNIVDLGFGSAIGSLQFANTNTSGGTGFYHTTQIASGEVLTVTNGLTVGTLADSGANAQVNAFITGAGGQLSVTGGNLVVNQASATSGAHLAVLNMTNLDTFTANIGHLQIGVANGVNRAEGSLYLAKTNIISLSGTAPQLYMGFNNGNNDGSAEFPTFYLGESNAFFVDSITMSADKQGNPASRVLFNPVFTNNNPVAYFRGTNGNSSRVSSWILGSNAGQKTTSSISDCTNDYSGGTLDAMVNTMTIGISEQAAGATVGTGNGTFTFTAGTNDVNILILGDRICTAGSSVGNGTMNVNGTGTLVANDAICLSYWTPGGNAGFGNGILNINGGTVLANTITNGVIDPGSVGVVNANVIMNGGFLGITSLLGSIGTTAWPLGIVTLSDSTLELPVSGIQTNVVTTLLNLNGTTNIINISTIPATVTNYPTEIPLIAYQTLSGFNIGVSNLPGTYQGYLTNNTTDSTIDLVLTSGPTSISTLEWQGAVSANWDTTTKNWLNIGLQTTYSDGDAVLFDDNATGSTAVNLTGVFSPESLIVSNNVLSYSFSGAGINGAGNLIKYGTGTALLTNSGNAFAGGVTVNAGTVQFGNGGTSGNLPMTGNVVDNGNLVLDWSGRVTLPNAISGTGTLNKTGTSIVTVTAANTFAGAAAVNGGTLVLNGVLGGTLNNAVGSTVGGSGTNSGAVTINGTIQPSATTGLLTTFTAGGLTFASGGSPVFGIASGSNDMLQVNGDLDVNNNVIGLNFTGRPQTGTPYTLISYTGAQNGSFSSTVTGTHYTATVNQGTSPITVTISGSGANLEWDATTNTVWDVGTTSNWLNQGSSQPDVFYAGDNVLFDEGVAGVESNVTIAAGVSVVPSLITVNVTNDNFSIGGSGNIGGGASIQKNGPGTLSLNTGNTYTGNTTVAGGILKLGANGADGTGTTYISSGATLDLNNNASGSVQVAGAGVGGNGAIVNSFVGGAGDQVAFDTGIYVYIQGNTSLGVPNRWDIRNGNLNSADGNPWNLTVVGSNLLALVNATIDDNLGNIDVRGGTLGIQTTTLQDSPAWAANASHTVTVENGAALELDLSAPTAFGQTVVLNAGSSFINDGTICTVNGPITLQGNATITNNAGVNMEIDGVIAGPAGFTKTGGSPLTLSAANTYGGSTLLKAGSLLLTGSGSISSSTNIILFATSSVLDASQRSDQTLTLASGQLLQGNGSINAMLVVSPGATLSAGTNSSVTGLLTVSNTVTLQGNALMKLNPATHTNDVIVVASSASLALGGTLTVTNVTGTAFAIGNSFQLFSAASYTGNFTTVVPATPGPGLAWNTNSLPSGTLSVGAGATTPQPQITGISLSGTSLVINGTNGLAGESYNVLTSTNLLLPVTSWTVLPTGTFSAGSFSITNSVTSGAPQSFYLLRVP